MKKSIIITTMLALLSGAAYAQPTGDQSAQQQSANAPTGSLAFLATLDEQAEASSDVDASASKYMREKGWGKGGVNANGLYIAKGSADIKAKPTAKNFESLRSMAFLEAMAKAKSAIANFYSQQVETRLEYMYEKPESAEAQKRKAQEEAGIDPSVLEKCSDLINAKLDKELAKEGVSYDSPKAKEIRDNILASSSVKSYIKTTARAQVGGLVISKIFEEDGAIAVVAYYSPNTLALAGAINGTGSMPKAGKRQGPSVTEWIQGLSLQTLYLSQGVQVTTDDEGNIVLISYAISPAASLSGDSKRSAMSDAETYAAANIRRFAGEYIVSSKEIGETMSSVELDDGSNESDAEYEKSSIQEISATAPNLKIPGINSVRDWSFKDPRSNTLVCGCVSVWSIKTGDTAIKDRERAKAMTTPAGGFKGTPEARREIMQQKSAPTNSTYKGDANIYKAESQEGETL